MIDDTRAVSPAVTQALAIGISTILVTGLLIGGSQLVTDQRTKVTRQGLADVGSGVTSDLVRLDQFVRDRPGSTMSFRSHYPDRIAGEQYRVRIDPGDPGDGGDLTTITVGMTTRDLSTELQYDNQEPICGEMLFNGDSVVFAYVPNPSGSGNCLQVTNR